MNRSRASTFTCKRSILTLALTLALSQTVLLTPPAVLADEGAVMVAGQTVFVNKAASGGLSADDRAQQIQRNLDNALVAAKDRSPASVNIVYVKGIPVITLGGYQVATIDADNAKAEGTTPALLAQKWADSLRGALQNSSSINSYVTQLSGGFTPGTPAASSAGGLPATQPNANPPTTQSNVPYQPYNQASGGPGGPGGGGYGAPGGGYGAPGGGYGAPGGSYGAPGGGYGAPGGGYGAPAGYDQYNRSAYGGMGAGGPQHGHVVYAPAGLVIPVQLKTSISTQAAQAGDLVEAAISQPVSLGDATIPPGSVLVGQITNAKAGGFMGRSGMLGIQFNRLRTPDGMETPITAHIQGNIGKYADNGGVVHGETWKNKVGQVALRGALGAGGGAALGTAIGAIAGRSGAGAGRGAWSGTAIGGGLGVADSLLLRKGRDVTIHGGTAMNVQLDAPVTLSSGGGGGAPPYSGSSPYSGAPPYAGTF